MSGDILCFDCKHFEWSPYNGSCVHPDAPREPVYGRPRFSALEMREGSGCIGHVSGPCGNDGAWFEPKPVYVHVDPPKRKWWRLWA
jgi:hypothetical protein